MDRSTTPLASGPGALSRWLPVVAACAAIIGASSIPGRDLPPGPVVGFDKLVHACVYAVLGALVLRGLWSTGRRRAGWTVVAACAAAGLFGVLDELYQATTPGRSPEVADAVADFAGALAGAALASVILRRLAPAAGRRHGDDSQLSGKAAGHR